MLLDHAYYFKTEAKAGYGIVATSLLNENSLKTIENVLQKQKYNHKPDDALGVISFKLDRATRCIAFSKLNKTSFGEDPFYSHIFILSENEFKKLNYDAFLLADLVDLKEKYGIVGKRDASKSLLTAENLRDSKSKLFSQQVGSFIAALDQHLNFKTDTGYIISILNGLYSGEKLILLTNEHPKENTWLQGLLYLLPYQIRKQLMLISVANNVDAALRDGYDLIVATKEIYATILDERKLKKNVKVVDLTKKSTQESAKPIVEYIVEKLKESGEDAYVFILNLENYISTYLAENRFNELEVNKFVSAQHQLDIANSFEAAKKYHQAISAYLKAVDLIAKYSLTEAIEVLKKTLKLISEANEISFYNNVYPLLIEYLVKTKAEQQELVTVYTDGLRDIKAISERIEFIDNTLKMLDENDIDVTPFLEVTVSELDEIDEPDILKKYNNLLFSRYDSLLGNKDRDDLKEHYINYFTKYLKRLFTLRRFDIIKNELNTFSEKVWNKLGTKGSKNQEILIDIFVKSSNDIINEYIREKTDVTVLQNRDTVLLTSIDFLIALINYEYLYYYSTAFNQLAKWYPLIGEYASRLDVAEKTYYAVESKFPILTEIKEVNSFLKLIINDLKKNEEDDLIHRLIQTLTKLSLNDINEFYYTASFVLEAYLMRENLERFKEYINYLKELTDTSPSATSEFVKALANLMSQLDVVKGKEEFFDFAFITFLQVHFKTLGYVGLMLGWKQFYQVNSRKKLLISHGIEAFKAYVESRKLEPLLNRKVRFALLGFVCNLWDITKEKDKHATCIDSLYNFYRKYKIPATDETVPFLLVVAEYIKNLEKIEEFNALEAALVRYYTKKNALSDAIKHLNSLLDSFTTFIDDDKTKYDLQENMVREITELVLELGYSPSTETVYTRWLDYNAKFVKDTALAWNMINSILTVLIRQNEIEEPARIISELLKDITVSKHLTYSDSILKVAENLSKRCLRENKECLRVLHNALFEYNAGEQKKIRSYVSRLLDTLDKGIYSKHILKTLQDQKERLAALIKGEKKLRKKLISALSKLYRTPDESVRKEIETLLSSYKIDLSEIQK